MVVIRKKMKRPEGSRDLQLLQFHTQQSQDRLRLCKYILRIGKNVQFYHISYQGQINEIFMIFTPCLPICFHHIRYVTDQLVPSSYIESSKMRRKAQFCSRVEGFHQSTVRIKLVSKVHTSQRKPTTDHYRYWGHLFYLVACDCRYATSISFHSEKM